jgi:hypothetical protein
MKLADMDIEVATRILTLRAQAVAANAESELLSMVEAYRHNPTEKTARAAIEAHDRWTLACVESARAKADQHLSALIEEMEDMVDLDGWTEAYLREVAHDRLDMSSVDD